MPKKANLFMLYLLLFQFAIATIFSFIYYTYNNNFYLNPYYILILQLLNFGIPFIAYFLLTADSPKVIMPMKKLGLTNSGLIIILAITIQPIMMIISAVSSIFFENIVPGTLNEFSGQPIYLLILLFAVSPAFLEEIVFRGIIFANNKHIGLKKSAVINGLFFAVIHLNLQQFVYAFILGVLLTYFVHYTKSIYASILAHFVFNSTQILLSLHADNYLNTTYVIVLSVIFMPVFIIVFNSFIGYNKRKNTNQEILSFVNSKEEPDMPLASVEIAKSQNRFIDWAFVAVVVYYVAYIAMTLLYKK